jgi:hypothetical protein
MMGWEKAAQWRDRQIGESDTAMIKNQPLRARWLLADSVKERYNRAMEHHVYFWLKENYDNAESRAVFEAGLEKLTTSEFIARHHYAKPAETAQRPVTDHSWSYAISFQFSTMADHDAYQENDPVHDEFIASYKDWWEKVLVMDLA